jgi:hypothetical protein
MKLIHSSSDEQISPIDKLKLILQNSNKISSNSFNNLEFAFDEVTAFKDELEQRNMSSMKEIQCVHQQLSNKEFELQELNEKFKNISEPLIIYNQSSDEHIKCLVQEDLKNLSDMKEITIESFDSSFNEYQVDSDPTSHDLKNIDFL